MSITRQTIKRLQKEVEGLNPDKDRLYIIKQDEGGFYYNERSYKTLAELKEKEGIKNGDRVIAFDKLLADKYDIK